MRVRMISRLVVLLALIGVTGTAVAAGPKDLRILTYPIGLVTGKVPVHVDLGAEGTPAKLYLDGTKVCSLTIARPSCTVDVGSAPHVHLLELIRRDAGGRVVGRATRWVNRPGQEAELGIRTSPRSSNGICGGEVLWSHPEKKNPVVLEVKEDGRSLRMLGDRRSFRFPCPDPNQPHVLAASAIFPDGRRAEAVALSGGFGGQAEAQLTAVPLVAGAGHEGSCQAITAELGGKVMRAERGGFEVVFVLDPSAAYGMLYRSGWFGGRLPTTSVTTKAFQSMVRQGARGTEPRPHNSWKKAEASLIGADKLWFVAPGPHLGRVNGFGAGKMNWLGLLFRFGSAKIKTRPRIADAVAASGLVAAAGPRRRAVILLLGSKAAKDASTFTPAQAQSYLAEVGVPLFVLRNAKRHRDAWPRGYPAYNMEGMAKALETVKENLDSQCMTWFPGEVHPALLAKLLPSDLHVAGQGGATSAAVEDLWRRAKVSTPAVPTPGPEEAKQTPAWKGQVNVTAVTVLVIAKDAHGGPVGDLTASDVKLTEDGKPAQVLGLRPISAAPPSGGAQTAPAAASPTATAPTVKNNTMPVAVYVDTRLSGSADLAAPLKALAARAQWLTSLGPVDVIVAGSRVDTIVENSRNPEQIQNALDRLAAHPSGQHAIEKIRKRFLRDSRRYRRNRPGDFTGKQGPLGPPQNANPENPTPQKPRGRFSSAFNKAMLSLRSAVSEEDGLLRQVQVRLQDWALAAPTARPRLLFPVGVGFDEDPTDFYIPYIERIEPQNADSVREELKRYRQSARVQKLGNELAAAGWLVMPVASRSQGAQLANAELSGDNRFQNSFESSHEGMRTGLPTNLLVDPLGPERELAAPSGGEVLMGGKGLDKLAGESAGWYRLTYQVDRPADGALHTVALTTSRPGIDLETCKTVASETSEDQAAARVRRLLRGAGEPGELNVAVAVGPLQKGANNLLSTRLTLDVGFEPIGALFANGQERVVRVSVGVGTGDGPPFILHRIETVTTPSWKYTVPLEWMGGGGRLAVVVEDLGSGAWGAVTKELPGP